MGKGPKKNINIFFRLFSGSQVFNRINLSQVSQAPEIRQPVQAPLQVLKVNLDRPGQARLGRPVQAIMSSTDECSPTSFSAYIGLANDHICDISGTAGQAQDPH